MKINFIYRPDRGEYTTYINESYHGMLNPHELLKLINILVVKEEYEQLLRENAAQTNYRDSLLEQIQKLTSSVNQYDSQIEKNTARIKVLEPEVLEQSEEK